MSAVDLRPVAVRRWPDGERWGMPCLVTVLCPFCGDEHTHGVNATALLDGHTWACHDHATRHGTYRVRVDRRTRRYADLRATA